MSGGLMMIIEMTMTTTMMTMRVVVMVAVVVEVVMMMTTTTFDVSYCSQGFSWTCGLLSRQSQLIYILFSLHGFRVHIIYIIHVSLSETS